MARHFLLLRYERRGRKKRGEHAENTRVGVRSRCDTIPGSSRSPKRDLAIRPNGIPNSFGGAGL